jgi:DNA-binding IclR family transcriptional regulator
MLGIADVGVPVFGCDGKPVAALSIAALSDRISSRLDALVEMLKREAEVVADVKGKNWRAVTERP